MKIISTKPLSLPPTPTVPNSTGSRSGGKRWRRRTRYFLLVRRRAAARASSLRAGVGGALPDEELLSSLEGFGVGAGTTIRCERCGGRWCSGAVRPPRWCASADSGPGPNPVLLADCGFDPLPRQGRARRSVERVELPPPDLGDHGRPFRFHQAGADRVVPGHLPHPGGHGGGPVRSIPSFIGSIRFRATSRARFAARITPCVPSTHGATSRSSSIGSIAGFICPNSSPGLHT